MNYVHDSRFAMSAFKDLGKSTKDLLEENYFLSKRLQIKTKNDSAVEG